MKTAATPGDIIINNADNVWVLILVAIIGAAAVLSSAGVALRGQKYLHDEQTSRETRSEVSAALADLTFCVGTIGTYGQRLQSRPAHSEGGLAVVAQLNEQSPKVLRSLLAAASAADSEVRTSYGALLCNDRNGK